MLQDGRRYYDEVPGSQPAKRLVKDLATGDVLAEELKCRICTQWFRMWRFKPRSIPDDVCALCCRGPGFAGMRRFLYMQNALDAIANAPCVEILLADIRLPDTECKCPTCTAGRVYDELFPSTDPEKPSPQDHHQSTQEEACPVIQEEEDQQQSEQSEDLSTLSLQHQ